MVKFDFPDLARIEQRIAEAPEQIAFACARALNDSVDAARNVLINQTWPKGVSVRDGNFMNAALTTKGQRATKRDLSATLYDKLGRASLALHEDGGTKRPKTTALAIPSKDIQARRGAKGVPKNLRPRQLAKSFRRGDVIYQPTGRGKKRSLKLMYVLKSGVPIRGTVHFQADFDKTVQDVMQEAFPRRFAEAWASRRKS